MALTGCSAHGENPYLLGQNSCSGQNINTIYHSKNTQLSVRGAGGVLGRDGWMDGWWCGSHVEVLGWSLLPTRSRSFMSVPKET